MRNSTALRIFLIISGLLLTFIGGATLFLPVAMKSSAGIDITDNISVINDVRASSALLLAIALLALLGAFVKKLTYSASLISSMSFLSLGIGRAMSIVLDGMPVEGLVKATVLEFALGILGAVLFMVYREKH